MVALPNAPPFPSRPPATGRQPTDAVATTAARSNPWRERAEAAGSVLERLILGSSSSDRVPWREEESRKSKGGFFVLSRVSSADSAFLGSGNEAARVAAPVPPSPGSSSLKFRAFFSLAGVPLPPVITEDSMPFAGGCRVRVLGAGVRVLRVLRPLRWEEGVPVRGHGTLHSAGESSCLLFFDVTPRVE